MELFFLEQDSLYKIFTTLQKLPDKKEVSIFIEEKNPFFDNPWRAKQIQQVIVQKQLDATFVVHHIKQKLVYEQVGLNFVMQKEQRRKRLLRVSTLFFFNIKKFHWYMYQKKNYVFYLMLGLEAILISLFLYFLSILILPSVVITIRAQREVNELMYNFRYFDAEIGFDERDVLSVPYYKETVSLFEEAVVSETDLTYYSQPARGTVRMTNNNPQALRLRENTQLVTDDGLLFVIPKKVAIPGSTAARPGMITIEIEANPVDVDNILMGERGNITQGSSLRVRLLERSSSFYETTEIQAVFDFQGGSLVESETLRQEDTDALLEQLRSTLTGDSLLRRLQELHDTPDTIVLPFVNVVPPFRDIVSWTGIQKELVAQSEDNTVRARVQGDVTYAYVYRDDIMKAVDMYLSQRPSPISNILSINKSSLSFFPVHDTLADVYIVPTQISVIQGYDFARDPHGVLGLLPDLLVGQDEESAREVLLNYDEIGDTDISLSPARSQTLPTTKSRITLKFQE